MLARFLLLAIAAPLWGADALESLLDSHCSSCHGAESPQAGVSFPKLLEDRPLVRNREVWQRVRQALEMRRMPPEGAPHLSEEQRAQLLDALVERIDNFDYSSVDNPGFEPIRRLTHTEYDNTIRDLVGVDLALAKKFTAEMTGETGFDNSANTLFLQSTLMERYIAAAERLVEEGLEGRPEAIFVDAPPERIIERFLQRAFRRRPSREELSRALGRYEQALADGADEQQAIKSLVPGILISPKFLYRVESSGEGVWAIDDWELASRLSYFLWASMPDDELFELAASNRLHEPDVLERQLARMLEDEKADTLGTVFAAQWLGFGAVGSRVRMGPIDFPWCTDSLMDAMRAESSMFFMSLIRENAPIRRLIDADYTFLNQELAGVIYEMNTVKGEHMRRVRLDDPNRGGVLGQATTLAITSNYNKTSPVKRGHWILEHLLGTPPPPPPPNAGVFEEEVNEQRDLTFREKLAMHSDNESCRSCHAMIDPLGFGLENFDYFGQWRDRYRFRVRVKEPDDINVYVASDFKTVYKEIDVTGVLPEGTVFDGPAQLKKALVERRHDDLVRQTVRKMLAYALGRQLEYYDEPAVRKIIAALEEDGYRFQTLIRKVVASYPFRYKAEGGDIRAATGRERVPDPAADDD